MIEIWCDGAASHNGRADAIGGWGWMVQFPNEFPILYGGRKDGATNQQMELAAMINALCFVQGELDRKNGFVLSDEQVKVYTDSAYIANCYKQNWYKAWETNGWVNSKKEPVANRDQWECLVPFFKRSNIEIIKVKGHADNFGNQVVDKLAVAARTMDNSEFCEYRQNLQKEVNDIFKEDLF